MKYTQQLPLNKIFTVSELNRHARQLIEQHFASVTINGEISNLVRPQSGHYYFSLKDSQAQIRCAFFRQHQRRLQFELSNGQQVMIQAQVSLYETRGDFQLIASHVELAGDGALRLAFEKLKAQLNELGLFASKHKKTLPTFPRCVGVITSSTGAALQDILRVLKRRCRTINIIVYHSMVQGPTAAAELTQAITLANQRQECDVLIIARGGGTLEDLQPFNEKMVAQAIFNSQLPIVSGIGHEIDLTIADLVADYRAATPSAAAETVSPDQAQWQQTLINFHNRLRQLMLAQLNQQQLRLNHLSQLLQHPQQRLQQRAQELDRLEQHLRIVLANLITRYQQQLQSAYLALNQANPIRNIHQLCHQLTLSQQRLITAVDSTLKNKQQFLEQQAQALNALNPLNTLKRGYSLTFDHNQHLVIDATTLQPGDSMNTRLANGHIKSIIKKVWVD